MNRKAWGSPTSPDVVARRAAGRRRYNAVRQLLAAERRALVARLALELSGSYAKHDCATRPIGGWIGWGLQAEIARRLGVHRSTVSRDLQRSLREVLALRPCPGCGRETLAWRLRDSTLS
jgi:hypothetical protein